jgi:hypothetical protein
MGRANFTARSHFPWSVALCVGVLALSASLDLSGTATAGSCPKGMSVASPAQRRASQAAFTADFGRIRTYLLNPTTENQLRVYQRVDAALFEYYSWQGGQLNSNRGHARGTFTFRFLDGSECVAAATQKVTFQVVIKAQFTSTNRRRIAFVRTAHVEMKTPRITSYIDPVTR